MGLQEEVGESLTGDLLHKADIPIPCPVCIQHPSSPDQLEEQEKTSLGRRKYILPENSYTKASVC